MKETKNKKPQSGAALVTVLFISLLLLTASAAMLTAVGSNSRNTTDVLSETKAYYAAETGIQATVNVLRNFNGTGIVYSSAVNDGTAPRLDDLSNWLPSYVGGQIPIGTGTNTGYSISVINPDNGAPQYSSAGKFLAPTPQIIGNDVWIPSTPPATPDGTPRTRITIGAGYGPSPTTPNTQIASFLVEKVDGGTNVIAGVKFRLDYVLTAPRTGVASIYGTIAQPDASSPISVTFQSRDYRVAGGTMQLCTSQASGCGITSLASLSEFVSTNLFISSSTSFSPEPYRLKLTSSGYGPNGAKKTLEAIIRRNVFDGYDAPATMTLIGPNSDNLGGFVYQPGTSANVVYSGGNCAERCIPSFAVTDQQNLDYIVANTPGNVTLTPPDPRAVDFSVLPSWLQSPDALESVIRQLRVTAQHSNRYYGSNNVPNLNSLSPTGIIFCEGSCSVTGTGGGLLVVTGQLTATGNFNFAGLILVVGQEGITRTGGGGGDVSGNIIIAPYNKPPYTYPYPSGQMSATFLTPRYNIPGGGGSVVPLADVNSILDGTSAVSDVVAGVAEK